MVYFILEFACSGYGKRLSLNYATAAQNCTYRMEAWIGIFFIKTE